MKTSDATKTGHTLEEDRDFYTPGHLRLQPSFETIALYSHQKSDSLTSILPRCQYSGSTKVQSQPISVALDLGTPASEGRTVRPHSTLLRKRTWWLYGTAFEEVAMETRVEIKQEGDLEGAATQVNGVQGSRPGQHDYWL
jgi:hypothetical protein